MYNMKIITTTEARKHISNLVDEVKYSGEIVGIGRRSSIDVVIIPFPHAYNKAVNDITNINTYSRSFDFLQDEPELYSTADIKKHD
jgi:antitoxin (DNA-binding transcriptional repressor) of toxin-antitoxin stability system